MSGDTTTHLRRGWLSRESTRDTISTSSSSCSSIASRESDSSDESDDYDDILNAVSILFEKEEGRLQDTSDAAQRDVGLIIARVIPKERIGFNEKKPLRHRLDNPRQLRLMMEGANPLLQKDLTEEEIHWKDDNKDPANQLVALEVRLSLSPKSARRMSGNHHRKSNSDTSLVDMRLLRAAKEPARKTLKRLHLSIAKKLGCETFGANLFVASKGNNCSSQLQTRQGVCVERSAKLATEPSIWVRESSGFEDDEDVPVEEEEVTSSQRQFYLNAESHGHSVPPHTKEMHSACLWNELAEFEGSRLYFGIHPNGPLLPLEVDACPPTVLNINVFEDFQARHFVGVPIVVELTLLHATHAQVGWFLEDDLGKAKCVHSACVSASDASSSYTPSNDDIGKSVSVVFVPMRAGHTGGGCEEAYKFQHTVEGLPPMPIVSPLRKAWTTDRLVSASNQNVRVLSYNLLADWYAGRAIEACKETNKGKKTEGFYSYCNSEFLTRSRRFPMLVAEILSYQPDIVCLQEVDEGIFHSLLMPVMRARGYQGYFSSKASVQSEGCAMFWSLQVFQRASEDDMHEFHFCDFFPRCDSKEEKKAKQDPWAACTASIEGLLESNAAVREVLSEKVGQVVQVASLQPLPCPSNCQKPKAIVVGNTHLFFHPLADHIRTIQAYQACRYLETIRSQCNQTGRDNPPIIFCGDFNSHPLSGAVQLLVEGRLAADHFEAWRNLNDYSWDVGGNDLMCMSESFEDACEAQSEDAGSIRKEACCECGLSLHLPDTFPRLISGYPEFPLFTNYSVGFAETLDYVLVSEPSSEAEFGFRRVAAATMPTTSDMREYKAMPNEFMPSDHLSLVCELGWARHQPCSGKPQG